MKVRGRIRQVVVTGEISQVIVRGRIEQLVVKGEIALVGTDHYPPVLVSAVIGSVDNNVLAITFDKNVDLYSVPAIGDFAVSLSGGPVSITQTIIPADAGIYKTVIITLSRLVVPGETGTFNYTPGADPIRSEDDVDATVGIMSNVSITNNVT